MLADVDWGRYEYDLLYRQQVDFQIFVGELVIGIPLAILVGLLVWWFIRSAVRSGVKAGRER